MGNDLIFLFLLVTDFWPKILLTSDYFAEKIIQSKILLINDFGPELISEPLLNVQLTNTVNYALTCIIKYDNMS